ncbi:MAG: glycoside hydrolase family 65 protein, partial [Thermoleophilaceae bacterium]
VEVDQPTRLVVQSELIANESGAQQSSDPRAAAALRAPLVSQECFAEHTGLLLSHATRSSGLLMTAAAEHEVHGPGNLTVESEAHDDGGRVTFAADVGPGESLRITKYLAYSWSSRRALTSVRAQARGSLAEARHTGWDGLVAEQREYLDEFWANADVELEGDHELQQAVRFALFGVLQASARGEGRAIAAKGLTGSGYDGHAFWDTESFVLPVLTYTVPVAVRDALRWRHAILPVAKSRAEQLGLNGAAFPWRTIAGEECSAYWPAGTAAFHIDGDIAAAVARYVKATDDDEFARGEGLDLLVETARLFCSLGHFDSEGGFHIDGVTGPDEYSALGDDNVYTNLMAQSNLRAAAEAAEHAPEDAARLEVDDQEIAGWRRAADSMAVPYDPLLEVHPQDAGFTRHAVWDFESTGDRYPLLLHFPYFELYRQQVVKQADLVLALHVRGDAFTAEEKVRDFAYYEALTVRDSSLSACTQAVVAAELGHLQLAYDYFAEAARMDLEDLEHNTRDGLHIASLAGCWIAAVAGFGGLRDHYGRLAFAPRLPLHLERLSFRLRWRGSCILVAVGDSEATYELLAGDAVQFTHYGEPAELSAGEPLRLQVPKPPQPAPVRQPPGREPRHHEPAASP